MKTGSVQILYRFWIPTALIAVLMMTGCGTTSSHYLNKEYGKDEFRAGPVGYIALGGSDVIIDAYEQYQKAFEKISEEDGRKMLAQSFNDGFLSAAKRDLKNLAIIDSGAIISPYNQVETKLMLDQGKKSQRVMRIDMPRKAVIDSMRPPIRFLIIPRAASLSYTEGEAGNGIMDRGLSPGMVGKPGSPGFGAIPGTGAAFSSNNTKKIKLTLKFAIWDCKKERAVSYGTYEDSMQASFFFTKGEWLNLMDRASGVLLRNSPLKSFKSGNAQQASNPM